MINKLKRYLNNQNKKDGYILVLSLMMISILFILVTGMFYNSTSYTALTSTAVNREKAKMLALGGLKIAYGKLTLPAKKEEKVKKQQSVPPGPGPGQRQQDQSNQELKNKLLILKKVLPTINRWEVINLKQEIDGVEGRIQICISSEDGKVNINKLFDFKEHKIFGKDKRGQDETKAIFDTLDKGMRQFTNRDLVNPLLNYLKKREYPLNDVTELLEISEFNYFNDKVFYEPPKSSAEKRAIYLTDIFTTWTEEFSAQPWLLSDSLCAIFGLKRVAFNDLSQRLQLIDAWLKNFQPEAFMNQQWDKVFKPIYNKDFNSLPKIINTLFNPKFGSKFFSVVSYGTVGEVTQRIFAIVEMQILGNNETKFNLKKLYWI